MVASAHASSPWLSFIGPHVAFRLGACSKKWMSVRDVLEDEHSLVEHGLNSVVSGTRIDESVRRVFDECVLLKHMYVEEILFPRPVSTLGVSDVVRGLELEHGAALRLLERARRALEADDAAPLRREVEGVLRILRGSGSQLGHHQREEETV